MDLKAQHFVHLDIFIYGKLELTHYYYWPFLFLAKGTLFAVKALIKIDILKNYEGCSSDSNKMRYSGWIGLISLSFPESKRLDALMKFFEEPEQRNISIDSNLLRQKIFTILNS